MNLFKTLFDDKPNPNDPKVVAAEIMERVEVYKKWFEEMERIHFVFGMPHQWQPLEKTIEGVIK